MPSWPGTLPDTQFIGLVDASEDERVQTQMDAGPPKIRKRFTAPVRNIQIPIIFTSAEKVILDTFWITTLSNGTLSFDWEDPVDDSTVTYEFVSRPQFKLAVGHSTAASRLWEGVLNLRIIP